MDGGGPGRVGDPLLRDSLRQRQPRAHCSSLRIQSGQGRWTVLLPREGLGDPAPAAGLGHRPPLASQCGGLRTVGLLAWWWRLFLETKPGAFAKLSLESGGGTRVHVLGQSTPRFPGTVDSTPLCGGRREGMGVGQGLSQPLCRQGPSPGPFGKELLSTVRSAPISRGGPRGGRTLGCVNNSFHSPQSCGLAVPSRGL